MPLYYATQYFSTKLATTGGIDSSQTTGILLQDISGLDISKPGIACITYSDPLNTTAAEFVTYTNVNGSTNGLEGVTRGEEGFSSKSHTEGVVISFPISKSHINQINEAIEGATVDPYGMYRNPLPNSNFDIWTRDVVLDFTSSSSTQSGYLADNHKTFVNPGDGTSSDVYIRGYEHTPGEEDGSRYYHRAYLSGAVTGGGFGSSGSILTTSFIEDGARKLCGDGKSVTVKFRLKSDVDGAIVGVNLLQSYGTGGSPSSDEVLNGTTFTLTTDWAEYEHTFTTTTLSGKTFGTDENSSYLRIDMRYAWSASSDFMGYGSEYNPSNVRIDWDWTQVNTGVVSLPYNPPLVADEQTRCERYLVGLQPNEYFPHHVATSGVVWFKVLSQKMRKNPTATGYFVEGATENLLVKNEGNTTQSGFTFTGAISTNRSYSISASKTSHGLTNAVLVVGAKGCLISAEY